MGDRTRSVNVSFVSPTGHLPLAWMNNCFLGDRHSSSDPEVGRFGAGAVLMSAEQYWGA